MNSLTTLCQICNKAIFDSHGNRKQHDKCGKVSKLLRSKRQYATLSMRADPYWLNEKILRTFYREHGNLSEIDPKDLVSAGFDFDLYSTENEVNGRTIFWMKKFGFSITENKKIIIWKM